MSELFEIPNTLSPRLAWLDKHGIWTREADGNPTVSERWIAEAGGKKSRGADEDEAIVNLAKLMGIKLWNEV